MPAKRGRPPSFSRDELIAAARRLGPEGISLQAVAEELGVARTSLYWHVRHQAELGELVFAHLVHEASVGDWTPSDGATWEEWLDAYARALRRTVLAAGEWFRYATARLFYSRHALRSADRLLTALLDAGFSIEEATRALDFVTEIVWASVRASTDMPSNAGRDDFLAEINRLDVDDVPTLRRSVEVREQTSTDAQFEYDLACALAGIATRAAVRR
jgi:TetR/AcrR family transcriptional regulator, tetracycline repressor protein